MKTKLITGRYEDYEVCYANKGQIFPRDGWYLTKGDDVIYIEDALAQTREETLKELIREYQDNELDGKGYDFYFSIRAKIDELNKLKKVI